MALMALFLELAAKLRPVGASQARSLLLRSRPIQATWT